MRLDSDAYWLVRLMYFHFRPKLLQNCSCKSCRELVLTSFPSVLSFNVIYCPGEATGHYDRGLVVFRDNVYTGLR